MSSKLQPQSPLRKGNKLSSQQQSLQQFMSKKNHYNISKSPFMTEGQKINFQSQDSEGSDISYQSSIESEDDINIGQIQYFKEEMGRFFINYPELINHDILESHLQADLNYLTSGLRQGGKPQRINNNWALISDQILNQAKDSSSFLESLSHRIALYRSKIYQEDLIDVLLKQEKNIMKEIELEINLKKKQNKGAKNTMMEHTEGCQNVYFSWRKKKEIQNKLNIHREQNQNQRQTIMNQKKNDTNTNGSNFKSSPKTQNNKNSIRERTDTLSNNKLTNGIPKSLSKKISDVGTTKSGTFFLTSNDNPSLNQPFLDKKNSKTFHISEQKNDSKTMGFNSSNWPMNRRPNSLGKNAKPLRQNERKKTLIQENEKENKNNTSCGGQSQTFWKHLVNFQPRTEAGRQLCELIRRTNNPNDDLGIKKTIMQFLVRNKETVQNQIILKSTISQKIQKLYNDDSKQLLMFYPTKMTLGQSHFGQNKQESGQNDGNRHSGFMRSGLNNLGEFGQGQDGGKGSMYQGMNGDNKMDLGNKLFGEGEKFMHLLEDIVEGPLMKYWMMLQENKL